MTNKGFLLFFGYRSQQAAFTIALFNAAITGKRHRVYLERSAKIWCVLMLAEEVKQ